MRRDHCASRSYVAGSRRLPPDTSTYGTGSHQELDQREVFGIESRHFEPTYVLTTNTGWTINRKGGASGIGLATGKVSTLHYQPYSLGWGDAFLKIDGWPTNWELGGFSNFRKAK